MATTKTMHKAKRRTAKEKKAKEIEERKAAVAARKLTAQAKKRAKLIPLMKLACRKLRQRWLQSMPNWQG